MNFSKIQTALTKQIKKMSKFPLFRVNPDRDLIWSTYLEAFPIESRQEHNCNACRSFLRQYGGIVALDEDTELYLWDIQTDNPGIRAVLEYVKTLTISDIFLTSQQKCGVKQNLDPATNIIWKHFYIEVPDEYVRKGARALGMQTELSLARSKHDVCQRAIHEISMESVDTVIALIKANRLYRGSENTAKLLTFKQIKQEYLDNPATLIAWRVYNSAAASIRSTAIGTLLVDLSENKKTQEGAITSYEAIVAPANYQRTQTAVSTRQVDVAKAYLTEAGYIDALERRTASPEDVPTEHLLFIENTSGLVDPFEALSKETVVNMAKLSKVPEIPANKFISDILPTNAGSLEIIPEGRHMNNFMCLLTEKEPGSKSLFKWENPFSWSYRHGVTDSIKERVKQAGGNVEGVLRFSITWNEDGKSIVDLDAHAYEPGANGKHIYFMQYRDPQTYTPMTGHLDVDMVNPATQGVENITWENKARMRPGDYKFCVHNYNSRRHDGFRAQIAFDGKSYDLDFPGHFTGTKDVCIVNLSDNGVFTIKDPATTPVETGSENTTARKFWGVNLNCWQSVSRVMFSPNYWAEPGIGNKHLFFLLKKCMVDEKPRPFYNEFLNSEVSTHRRVLESLADKISVTETENQAAGLGFSETIPNHVFAKVNKTIYKVIF